MSEMSYSKSVYASRSHGYKYRTSATNTEGKSIDVVTQTMKIGEKKRRDEKEDNVFDTRFKELKEVITSKIDQQFSATKRARDMLLEKLVLIDQKIDNMLQFQSAVQTLKKELTVAENLLCNLHERVEKLDVFSESSTSTLLYLPGGVDTRDVIQQRGDLALLIGGDYYQNNEVDPYRNVLKKT